MTIKNGDMPAMPCVRVEMVAMKGAPLEADGSIMKIPTEVSYCGMTKREQLAAMADVQVTFDNYFTNYRAMCEFVGVPEFDFSHRENCLALEMMVKAKLRVMDADALLNQLEKTGE